MRYKLNKKQIIAEANKIRSELRYSKMDDIQMSFLKKFASENKKNFIGIALLILFETFLGLSLPTISHFYLEKSFALMKYQSLIFIGSGLIFMIFLYLANSYVRIYTIQKFTLTFINQIREAWYAYYLKHSQAFSLKFDGKKLMTKLLYHIQLLRLGINNIVYQGMTGLFLFLGILAFSFLFNPKLFVVLWLSVPVLMVLFFVMDYIGRYYITREQTFNSRIVGQLADSLINYDVLKSQAREDDKLKEFEGYIDLDTYFRIRRQLWVQFSNRALYGLILLFGVLLYFVQIYWPFVRFDSLSNLASTSIILGFFARVLFSVSRAGLFLEAFKLGLRLSIPSFKVDLKRDVKKIPIWKKLRFHSKKTKISKYSGYIKSFEFTINKGDRILVYGEGQVGKTTLAKVLCGRKCIDSIFIDLDKKRIAPNKWCRYKSDAYLVTSNPSFDLSLGEFLLGKSKSKINRDDVDSLYRELSPYKIFEFLFQDKDLLGKRITKQNLSTTEVVLIQIAYCILSDKSMIVLDHTCLDSQNEIIEEAVEILDKKIGNVAAIVVFSSKSNKHLEYEKTYNLGKTRFDEA